MQCAKLGCRPDFTTHVGRTGLTPTVSRLDSRLTYRERPDAAGTWRLARIDLPRGRVRFGTTSSKQNFWRILRQAVVYRANFGNFKFKRADDFILRQPSDAGGQDDPAAAETIDRGHGLGEHEGVVFGYEADTRPQPNLTCARRGVCQGRKGIGDWSICWRWEFAAGIGVFRRILLE